MVWPDAERLDGVGVLVPHYAIIFEVFRLRGVFLGGKFWGVLVAALQLFAVLIQGVWVGSKVVVEGNILRVNDNDVFNWGRGGCLGNAGDKGRSGGCGGTEGHSARAKLH